MKTYHCKVCRLSSASAMKLTFTSIRTLFSPIMRVLTHTQALVLYKTYTGLYLFPLLHPILELLSCLTYFILHHSHRHGTMRLPRLQEPRNPFLCPQMRIR